jgi:hypothetical protein
MGAYGGEHVFVLWLNHALMEMVRCLHDPKSICENGVIVTSLYPLMIVRAIMQFVVCCMEI